MQRQWTSLVCIITASLWLAACGSASKGTTTSSAESETSSATDSTDSASSSTTREVTGEIPASGTSASLGAKSVATGSACVADTVIATDTDGATITASIDDACKFSLSLPVGKAYVLSLANNGTFIATLLFNGTASGFGASTLEIGEGQGSIELGALTIAGTVATTANDPAAHNDRDGDGIVDAEDSDANGNGIDDIAERDCSSEEQSEDPTQGAKSLLACSVQSAQTEEIHGVRVLRVRPWNARHEVSLRKRVRALIACRLDRSSVDHATFSVVSEAGDVTHCHFRFLRFADYPLERITCRHDGDPFVPGLRYTATIDGLYCRDGRPVEQRSWSWVTRDPDAFIEAYDNGDGEDQLDTEASSEEDVDASLNQ